MSSFPQVTLADVYAALAYYHDNRIVIDEHIREDAAIAFRERPPIRIIAR